MKSSSILSATILTVSGGPASLLIGVVQALYSVPANVLSAVKRARDRRHTRRTLAELDDHLLRDIGLTRDQVGPRPLPRPFVEW